VIFIGFEPNILSKPKYGLIETNPDKVYKQQHIKLLAYIIQFCIMQRIYAKKIKNRNLLQIGVCPWYDTSIIRSLPNVVHSSIVTGHRPI